VESDLAIEVLRFDPETSVETAYSYGREDNKWVRIGRQYEALINRHMVPMNYEIGTYHLDTFLQNNFSHFNSPAQDAKLTYESLGGGKYNFDITEEKYGQKLNFSKAKSDLNERLNRANPIPIEIEAQIDYPTVFKADALNIEAKTNAILERAPLTLNYDWRKWTLNSWDLPPYLMLINSNNDNDKVSVGLNEEKLKEYLSDTVAPLIDREPIDPKFTITDGKVEEFQLSKDGELTNVELTISAIKDGFINGTSTNIAVVTDKIESNLTASEVNDMGIKELLGTGHSDFSGSPANRRHNIAVGAEAVNGTLIAPGEEFSLINTLGDIDKEAGYLPESVIKENKTIPEYGGGLCQIGTTAFRGTLAAGLLVTARRNHSYRVSYYEPAGTDATIYDPWPDYKFKNDYQNHVLITTRIEGNDLYFDFWGTKDGRTATTTYPVIYNITRPAETKFIETLDLEPGVKRCTEHAHNGADAYFDYTVDYAEYVPDDFYDRTGIDEESKTEVTRFKSHYVPWREVCLIGVEQLSEDKEDIAPEKAEDMTATSSDVTN
jgi:vancomycin resistance protein YoaR